MKLKPWFLAATAAITVLSACGGGGGTATSSASSGTTGVHVFGDSLADSGVFGFKWSVNAAGPGGTATPIWTDLIAGSLGKTVCNFYKATSFTNFLAPNTTCTSFAVGGGRINNLASAGGSAVPYSIPKQMDDAAAVVGGTFPAGQLMLVDGGGNDAADLVGAFLGATSAAGVGNYVSIITSLVPAATANPVIGAVPTQTSLGNAGGLYMQALANKFADDITSKLLNRGAKKVVVLNTPAVTNTPRFKAVLTGVAAAFGGGATGAAAAAQIEGLARNWVTAFNTQLAARLGGDSRIALVDFFTEFDNQVTNPAQYGIGKLTTACPVIGVDASGLPDYSIPTCTAAALDAGANKDWRTYAFSDGFHPSPYGYQLLAQLVARSMVVKGWL